MRFSSKRLSNAALAAAAWSAPRFARARDQRHGHGHAMRVRFEAIVILIALVSVVQFAGEWLARRVDHRG